MSNIPMISAVRAIVRKEWAGTPFPLPAPSFAGAVKHVMQEAMTRMSVRDIRLKWPEAERKLATGGEIVVTRDSKPVARILPYEGRRRAKRSRFDPAEHLRWLRQFWRRQPRHEATDHVLQRERAD